MTSIGSLERHISPLQNTNAYNLTSMSHKQILVSNFNTTAKSKDSKDSNPLVNPYSINDEQMLFKQRVSKPLFSNMRQIRNLQSHLNSESNILFRQKQSRLVDH